MTKRIVKLTEADYRYIRGVLIPIIDSYDDPKELTIIMNANTKDIIEYNLEAYIFDYLFGVKVKIANIKNDIIILSYKDTEDKVRCMNPYPFIILFNGYGNFTKENPTLPDKYIVNKDAAILFYGNNKTIVKRSKGDKVDPVKAFLWAYFLRNTRMSRTKANKYLQKVWRTFTETIYKK